MPELTGKNLGKVRIDMFLAQGGMADVYLGTHTTLQRAVAVKLMKSDIQRDPELQERFQREARVVAVVPPAPTTFSMMMVCPSVCAM